MSNVKTGADVEMPEPYIKNHGAAPKKDAPYIQVGDDVDPPPAPFITGTPAPVQTEKVIPKKTGKRPPKTPTPSRRK
ncbi:MAG TPA: hypothetical protein VGU72_04395 [Beijerinckiaceae bacterium]|jgi:hypothetical protein|nr:hypothetical protein [Beijerinckiaceae bacterium]